MKYLVIVFLLLNSLGAQTFKDIKAEASVAISHMSAEEAQQIALRRARAQAIEEANGVEVLSSTLVKDGALAMDFLKTYTNGIILNEKIKWLPITMYQSNPANAPIPEYNVQIKVDVKVIDKKTDLVFSAKLNKKTFINGDFLELTFISSDKANIAIFYLGTDDKIYKLLPEINETVQVPANTKFVYPKKNSDEELVMQSMKGYQITTEALWILATKKDSGINFSKHFLSDEYSLNEFSEIYAKIGSNCIEKILPYVIFEK